MRGRRQLLRRLAELEKHFNQGDGMVGDSKHLYGLAEEYFEGCIQLLTQLQRIDFIRGEFVARSWELIFRHFIRTNGALSSQEKIIWGGRLSLLAYEFYRLAGDQERMRQIVQIILLKSPTIDKDSVVKRFRHREWLGLVLRCELWELLMCDEDDEKGLDLLQWFHNIFLNEELTLSCASSFTNEAINFNDYITSLAMAIILVKDNQERAQVMKRLWNFLIEKLKIDQSEDMSPWLPLVYAIITDTKLLKSINISEAIIITDILNDAQELKSSKISMSSTITIRNQVKKLDNIWEIIFFTFQHQELIAECQELLKEPKPNRLPIYWDSHRFVLGKELLGEILEESPVNLEGGALPTVYPRQIIVFDTNVIYDMGEEIVHLMEMEAGGPHTCFALPLTVLNELWAMKSGASSSKSERSRIVMESMLQSRICYLTLTGQLITMPPEEGKNKFERYPETTNIECNDDAILYATCQASKHAKVVLITCDVNLRLKGSAWGVDSRDWNEFIQELPIISKGG